MTCRCCPICACRRTLLGIGFECSIHTSVAFAQSVLPPGPSSSSSLGKCKCNLSMLVNVRPVGRLHRVSVSMRCGVRERAQRPVQPYSCDSYRPAWGRFFEGFTQGRKHFTFSHIMISPFGHETQCFRVPEQLWLTNCLFLMSRACSVRFRFLCFLRSLGRDSQQDDRMGSLQKVTLRFLSHYFSSMSQTHPALRVRWSLVSARNTKKQKKASNSLKQCPF
jgi:hypothetical protein